MSDADFDPIDAMLDKKCPNCGSTSTRRSRMYRDPRTFICMNCEVYFNAGKRFTLVEQDASRSRH